MPLEIEAKLKVDDLDAVRHKLLELGAVRVASVVETNTFFDTEDRSLLAGDQGLRVRHAVPLDGDRADEVARVTFKGPRQPGPLKSRDELELGVDDPAAAAGLFVKLGFVRVLTFEKRRETFMLGGCEVALDELPRIGSYVEIEGEAEAEIQQVRAELGLADVPSITPSYVSLLLSNLTENQSDEREVRFA